MGIPGYVITSIVITLLIIVIFQAISQANRKLEDKIYENPKMAKEYVKRNKIILEKAIDLNKKVGKFLLIFHPVLFIIFFTIPVLGIILLTIEVLILIMYIFNMMITSSVKKKIKKFENL